MVHKFHKASSILWSCGCVEEWDGVGEASKEEGMMRGGFGDMYISTIKEFWMH